MMRYAFLMFSILSLIACNQDQDITLEIGEDFISSETQVFHIDTISTTVSTFKFDSLDVASANRLLIGNYDDPVFGKTKSKSFMQLVNFSRLDLINNDAVFDSIVLILNYDHYFYNDTIPSQRFNVYQVNQTIKPDEISYYNTTDFEVFPTPIGSHDFRPQPRDNDSIRIKLNDNFGSELLTKIVDNDITTTEEFLDDYEGFMVEGTDENTCILGFNTSSLLRLYYTIPNEADDDEFTIDFTINTDNTFNQTTNDPENTYFESLTDEEISIPSSLTDNAAYAQAGNGIALKVDIPYIERIADINGEGLIIDADLKITLRKNSDSELLHTRDSLQVFVMNQNGEILNPLFDSSGTAFGILEDNSETSPEFGEKIYSISVKEFLTQKLEDITSQDLFLAIYPARFNTTVDRYIFNGELAPDDEKIKLELTYLIYDDE
ncbi:DUF4270 family protein [Aquimarina rhabdastrellae]